MPFTIETAKAASDKAHETKALRRAASADVGTLAKRVIIDALLSKNSNTALRAAALVINEIGMRAPVPLDKAIASATALLPVTNQTIASTHHQDHPSTHEAPPMSNSDTSAQTKFSFMDPQLDDNKGVILDEYMAPGGEDGK